ncbi:MAG: trehalase family glycosidase [Bacteroidales bacterium]|nr:trehalase family glycosidase [Bacteroidales bacterium]
MKLFFRLLFFYLTLAQLCNAANLPLPSGVFCDQHDITTLSSWGPYSKKYAGISHIQDLKKGLRFDFSVMPGYYRNRQLVPHVLFESSYYPWKVNPSMDQFTYRYELEWKDRVFVDVTYYLLDSIRTLVGIRCVNHTDMPQNLVLNNMAYLDYPDIYPSVKAVNDKNLKWHNAVDYEMLEPARRNPRYHLVYDGLMRNEERNPLSIDGSLLAKGFGNDKGDKVIYHIPISPDDKKGALGFRFRLPKGKSLTFDCHGLIDHPITFVGSGAFDILTIPYHSEKAGISVLEMVSGGGVPIELDGYYVGQASAFEKLAFVSNEPKFKPTIEKGKNHQDFILKYEDNDCYYGVAWNYEESVIREILNSELESFFRKKVHNHVELTFTGDGKGHYTNAFLRPIVLKPQSEQTLYSLVCAGGKEAVKREIEDFHLRQEQLISDTISVNKNLKEELLPGSEKYRFGRQLLQANLLSNVVYPVYTQREYIRHFTPGKNWNSLYTWDLGFVALGLLEVDPVRAFECIRAYTTPVGSQSAFIHHGTPLPIQMFAYFDLWNMNQSREVLQFLYPRLKQYYDFVVGNDPTSTTRMKGSNLLKTWDYFYNSGGWDDYPPQEAIRYNKQQSSITTPVVTTAYYLRAAKILRQAAKEMALKDDVKKYDREIKMFADALQKFAWDKDAGYFGYVEHDTTGNAVQIFRHPDGSNFNKGLDGVSPLLSGICTPEQTDVLVNHLFSTREMWSDVGISTVDQSASYYLADGYWNGAVWMPHQWMMWKALLDAGRGEYAWKVAETALTIWEKECKDSYFSFEHFIISSARGAGWHQFSGLSTPVLKWFSAYYKVGKVSTGFEVWIKEEGFAPDYSQYHAVVTFDDATQPRKRCMLVCMNPAFKYEAFFDGKPVEVRSYHPGLVEITLPATNRGGIISINKLNNP